MDHPITPDDTAFCRRMRDVKHQLAEFIARKLDREFKDFIDREGAGKDVFLEEDIADLFDSFSFNHYLEDGATPVERFAGHARGLTDEERATLHRWRQPRFGIFRILESDAVSIRLHGLVNDVEYLVARFDPPGPDDPFHPRKFVLTTLLPIRNFFVMSGAQRLLARSETDRAATLAELLAANVPRLACIDNPARLEAAAAFARERHERFVQCFGTDEIVVPGSDVQARLDLVLESLRSASFPATTTSSRPAPAGGDEPPFRRLQYPDHITVGLVSDPVEGLLLLPGYDAFLEACRNPCAPNQVLLEYLDSEDIRPLVFRRAAERYPDTFSQAMARALARPGFDAARDLEPLLRQRKASHFHRPPVPGIVPIPTGRELPTSPRRWTPREGEPLPAPNDPCPCGSGRRYKKCCRPR